jgi:hypothetical protein
VSVPDPILCPFCNGPVVKEQQVPVFCMYFPPFYDDEGRRHHHDANGTGVMYTCGIGHEWSPPNTCWCGWVYP